MPCDHCRRCDIQQSDHQHIRDIYNQRLEWNADWFVIQCHSLKLGPPLTKPWRDGSTTKIVEIIADKGTPTGGTPIDKTDLTTLCLEKQLAANTTINLFDFFTKFNSPSHIILTAILLDNADPTVTPAVGPQVIGVDVQTIFFDYIDTTVVTPGSEWYNTTAMWLKLIQAN